MIQTYSNRKPIRVKINETAAIEVSSLSSLASNTWFYDPIDDKLYIKVNVPLTNAYYIYKNASGYYIVNLLDYSIAGQGDDFATLTANAITLAENGGGGVVYISPGEHIASQPIMLKSNVALLGVLENPTYTTIKQGPSEILYPGVIGIIDVSNVEVGYLTINMQNSPLVNGSSWPPKGNGITVRDDDYNNKNIYIHHIRLLNVPCYGIKTHFASDIKITDVYAENIWWDCANIESTNVIIENFIGTKWGDVGIAIYAAKNVVFRNSIFYNGMNPPAGGSSGVFGFTIEAGSRYVSISNIIVNNSYYAGAMYDCYHSIVASSIFSNGAFVIMGYNNMLMNNQFINSTVQIRGVNNHVINNMFKDCGITLQDNPDSFRIIGNTILNAPQGIRFLSNGTNGIIRGNHIYSDTSPPQTEYAINFSYRAHVENITVTDNDFTYKGAPSFSHGVFNLAECTYANIHIKRNLGYTTENRGLAINLADGSRISHGLAVTPNHVILTCLNATYNDVPVLVYWDAQNTNNNYLAVRIYWVNGTAITNNVIAVSWVAKYELP